MRAARTSLPRRRRGGRWRRRPAALPAVQAAVDTHETAGQLSVSLDVDTTRLLLGEVPAAFHAGVQDMLLIAFALAFAEFVGTGAGAPIGIDVEGHGRQEELGPHVDLSRTVGWFTTKYPVALTVGGLYWAQVIAGEAALGAVIKDAKEQLRALPDGLTYGLLRYLNSEVNLDGSDPAIGFNYLGRLGAGRRPLRGIVAAQPGQLVVGRCGRGGGDAVGAHRGAQCRHPGHRGRSAACTPTGRGRRRRWIATQVSRLSRLWFEALAGICAHVRAGGGGLTPSDIAPARLSQQQIDELCRQYRIADVLPLAPVQQGLLFHTGFAQDTRRPVCGAARYHRERCP